MAFFILMGRNGSFPEITQQVIVVRVKDFAIKLQYGTLAVDRTDDRRSKKAIV